MIHNTDFDLYQEFQLVLSRQGWSAEKSYLLAVSGGLDSMVMLNLFLRLSQDENTRISVVHINHHLRKESDVEAEFVEQTCRVYDITYDRFALDPASSSQSENVEAWARRERYRILNELADKENHDYIVTGHHLNDQAETILMHLADGCGLAGLRGIRCEQGRIIRPLLGFPRLNMEQYAASQNLTWVEDKSNQDVAFTRNFIRHNILPNWLEREPALLGRLARIAERADELTEAIDYTVEREMTVCVAETESGYAIAFPQFNSLPAVVQAGIVRKCTGTENEIWRRHDWDLMTGFLKKPVTGSRKDLPNDWQILCDRDKWLLEKVDSLVMQPCEVEIPGEAVYGNYRLQVMLAVPPKRFTCNPWTEYINYCFLKNKRLVLRGWQPGDRFIPLGMDGYKKVSDLLVDLKVNRFEKSRQLVLTADDEIVWVCGRRISDKVKLTKDTGQVLELSMVHSVGK